MKHTQTEIGDAFGAQTFWEIRQQQALQSHNSLEGQLQHMEDRMTSLRTHVPLLRKKARAVACTVGNSEQAMQMEQAIRDVVIRYNEIRLHAAREYNVPCKEAMPLL